ncbi:1-phosphatidylinositol 4 [Schistosoma japonicum]|nr:1-phosphatidylinositol 4 [Schistosoma japonicum]
MYVEMLNKYIQNTHSEPYLPWLPVSSLLTNGEEFSLYCQETENSLNEMVWQKVFVQIDLWGFFMYWNSTEQQVITTLDLMYIEDIEMCTDNYNLFQSMETSFLRLQISSDGLFESGKSMAYGQFQKRKHNQSSIILLLVKNDTATLKSWKDTLLQLVFTHYTIRIDLAPLELLWKQWTHLIIAYSSLSTWRKAKQLTYDRCSTIPNCCILAAFGLEGNTLPTNKTYLSEFSSSSTDIDCCSDSDKIEAIPLENFTFDVFFNLFTHTWLRDDISDLFSAYTKSKGYMNCHELNSFLQNSISFFKNPNVTTENPRNNKTTERHKTIRHIKYLHIERSQNSSTPVKVKSFHKIHSSKSQNNSCFKRSRSCYTTNETYLLHNRDQHDNKLSKEDIINVTGNYFSATSSPLHQDISKITDEKGIFPSAIINYEEFRNIVRRYETNQYAANKCLLTNEGFYRLLLSSTYRELAPSTTTKQDSRSSLTVVESNNISLGATQHPLAHYYIKSAYLTHKICKEDADSHIPHVNQAIYVDTVTPAQLCSQTTCSVQSNKILRSIRQALFLGIRALILDCHHLSRLVGTETSISNELIIVPSKANNVPTCFTEITSQDSFSLMRSILHKKYPYASLKSVLQVLKENIFLISEYPFILIINLYGLSQEQQCRLANLLQEYLGQWMMVTPLPKYTNNLNSNNSTENKNNRTNFKPVNTRHLPSPEMLKNKILLSIRLVQRSRSLSDDQSKELVTNLSQDYFSPNTLLKNANVTTPLTVFVTNPEGEQKSASQDIASTNSSNQISPPTGHKVINKSGIPEDLNMNRYFTKSCEIYANKIADRNATFTNQNEVSYLHPRLARLVVLPTPDFPPDACVALHYQYLLLNFTSNAKESDDKHDSESIILRKPQLKTRSEDFKNDISSFRNTSLMDTQNIRETDQESNRQLEEGELLTSLFNLITTRKSQLKHEDRKKRLLKRLTDEVYGNKTSRKRWLSHGNSIQPTEKMCTKVQPNKLNSQDDKIATKQGKGWFRNRKSASPTNPVEYNVHSKETLLSATVRYARRLSNASETKFNLSANTSKQNTVSHNVVMNSSNYDKHSRRVSTQINCDEGQQSTDVCEDDEQEYSDDLMKTSSVPFKRDLKHNKSPKFQRLKQTIDLNNHTSRRRSRKSTDSGQKRSPNSSCGHCSCSSGSRSEKGSPVHETDQRQTGQTKLGYFRDGIQKLRNKFASGKEKSFEKYLPSHQLASIGKSRNSCSESEMGIKSNDSMSSTSVSTSSSTVETSLSSNTESCESRSITDDSISSSSLENKVSKLKNIDSPMKTILKKSLYKRLSNVRHSISSLTNALFHQDKTSNRTILQKQSTIESQESALPFTKDYWGDCLKWFIGPRITNISSDDLICLLSKKQMTKSLARYNKERLTCVFLSDEQKSWDFHQLFHSAGCQLIPYELDVSQVTFDLDKSVSVRQQFMKFNQMDKLQNEYSLSENGYTLKPALLRIPTINRSHRKLITGYKHRKLLQKYGPTSNELKNQLTNYLRCACCYDPLDNSSELELISKIPDRVTNIDMSISSFDETNFYLPWNYTLQLINFMKIHSMHPIRILTTNQNTMGTQSHQHKIMMSHKLPKRYRRAANVKITATKRQRHASASRATATSNIVGFEDLQSMPTKTNAFNIIYVEHQSEESIDAKNGDNNFQERYQLNLIKRGNSENITIEAEIKAPLFKYSHLTIDLSNRFLQVPEEHNKIRYCLYSSNPNFSTDRTVFNQYALRKSEALSKSSYALFSMFNEKEKIPMFSSFSSMPRSNSELILDTLSTSKVIFSRIHLPESICIRVKAEIHREKCESDVKSHGNSDSILASCIINSNSPLNKTLTGFQHFRLQLTDQNKTRILPQEVKDDITEFNHSAFHQHLKDTIGLLIFCKVSMNTYVPYSLGDLIEILSKKYDTHLGNTPRRKITDQQCNTNRSKSYLYLNRQQSINESSTTKQPIIRSNSFTYKECNKNLKRSVI